MDDQPQRTTAYFASKVVVQRPYVTIERCRAVLATPIRREQQSDGRWRYWGLVILQGELGERIMRVVTLADGTLHNAFMLLSTAVFGRMTREAILFP